MKEVVSISLGSSKRDHEVKVKFLGEEVRIRRIGTDGDFEKAIQLLKEMDGKVDALGMGGIDLYLYAGSTRYSIKDAVKLQKAVKKTPLVDGSGLKNTLEREVVRYLQEEMDLRLEGKTVLMVSAVDRFGMAEALHAAGCKMIFGDLIFGLDIPIVIRSFSAFEVLARALLPIVTKMPFRMLYPTGGEQEEEPKVKYAKYYAEADIIAGDFLFIRKYMPRDMKGKWILTNTVTKDDVEDLKQRGVEYLITTTPELGGRSFGTNVMEAALVAFIGKPWDKIKADDYLRMLRKLNFKPRVEKLN
ncbi:MAG TPA: quinate 5-dehydrogenase [Actinobacteria bacterium]|nr:quinate 5-dehydrogenase [Actinomycetota bacterium]